MLFNAFSFQQVWQENNLTAAKLASKAHWVQGEILSLHTPTTTIRNEITKANKNRDRIRFNINVTHLDDIRLKRAIQLRLSWKNAALLVQQGQTVKLKLKFKPSHGLANQGSFSFQTWLNAKKISATGYVVNHKYNQVLAYNATMRQKLFNAYRTFLPEHELSPLLLALSFGSRAEFSPELWQVLQATGTGHLIAISGLHIGLVASAVFYAYMLLLRFLPLKLFESSHKLQRFNSRYFAVGLSMLAALGYGYLAGFSLPTIRALVMLSFYWGMRLLAIKISIGRWLLLTLFVITLSTPFSLFTASFWLSFYAVTVIFLTLWRFKYYLSKGHETWRFIKGLIVIQFSLTLMLLPISAVFFQQISVVALFANMIAVPWMSFISIPLCLLSVLLMFISETLSQFFIMLSLETIQVIWHYLTFLSTLSWAVIPLSNLSVKFFMLIGGAAFLILFIQPNFTLNVKFAMSVVGCSTIMLLVLILGTQMDKKPSNWQLVVFDVGQGLSILIKRGNSAVLYDTGAAYESGFNMVEAVVLPYLQHTGIKQLDKVFISHSDNDHAGGLVKLQQSIEIKELIYNVEKVNPDSTCLKGDKHYWQGLTFEVLWPEKPVAKENDDSCVLLISDHHHKILLTGDISRKIEYKLIKQYPQLKTDVLIVAHHGSKTSSSERFITHVKPELAIVSAGYLNRWHMPVVDVVNRYKTNKIELLNSAESGQISLDFSEKGITKHTYYDHLWPFWFAKSL